MNKSKLEIIRVLTSNLLKFLLSIPTEQKDHLPEINNIESYLLRLIEQIDFELNSICELN